MTSYQVRSAIQTDFEAVRNLIRAVRINPMGLDWRRFVVAVDSNGDLIGCGQIKPHRDGSQELASVAVHLEWRGRGVARALVENLLRSHPGMVYLTCRAELGIFYEKFGFRVAQKSEMPTYFRWVWRLFNILKALHLVGDGLLVMVRKPFSNQ